MAILQQQLSDENRRAIEGLLEPGPQGASRLAEARKLEHSTRNQGLRKSALALREFGQLYFSNEPVFEHLGLTDQAAEYYANWVIKAKTFQVNQFADRNKAYLYLSASVRVDALEEESRALQLAVAELVTLLLFYADNSDRQLMRAIEHFQTTDRSIGVVPPTSFLKKSEKEIVFKDGVVSKPLYKIFLFRAIFDGMKSGKLSLKYSFNFRALRTYMVDDLRWNSPRFKRIEGQALYSFATKASHLKEARRILPSRKIDVKVIEENWDDVLRFMATIESRYTTASQLFQRLNSYAKDHPLYRALKEFGRVLKSIHILTVYDDLEFRQRIQKQLNRVELSNKFSDAVFWDRGKQLHVSAKKEQEKYILCKTILQNSIILWKLFISV